MPGAVEARIAAAGGLWATITQICPYLARAERVIRASTSNGLYHAQTGEKYAGSGGEHVYIAVVDGADIERFLHALHDRCWLAGLGWYDVGAAGQLLDRSLVDRTVGSPERLVFEGGPIVHAPLAQDRTARIPHATVGDTVDTRSACPQLTAFEREQLAELRRADRHRVADRASAVRATFITAQAAHLVNRHRLPPAAARRMAEAQIGRVLLPFVALPWDDPDLAGSTVADVLSDPARFVGATLADPLEGIAYGRGVAIIMQRPDGSLSIHSFAHGRTIYQLRYDAAAVEAAIRAVPKDAMVETFLQLLPVATLEPDEETKLRDLICKLAGVKVRPLDKRIKEIKEKQAREHARAERSRRAAERTDPRPRRPAPQVDDERLPILRDLDAILCAVADPEPPMRDVEGCLTEVQVRAPTGLHALTSAGSNAEADDTRLPPQEQPLLTRHTDKTTAHLIEQHVEYAETTGFAERTVALHPVFVPHFMQFRASRLPIVSGIVTAPLVLPNGELLMRHGLERAHQLVYRIDPRLIEIMPEPEKITERHIARATRYLVEEWLVDVTADFAGKMKVIAIALTIIERVLLPERPCYFVTAGRRGGGKTTLIKTTLIMMAVAVVTGRLPPAAAWSQSEEERRKALFSYLCQAIDVLVWDNIPRGLAISCPSIEKSLTAPTYVDRVLGETAFRVTPSTTVQLFDGNSITPTGDLASRSLSVWLNVDRPDPENRIVTHVDPVGWTLAHRAKLLRALYIILLGNPRLAGGKQDDPKTRFRTWWHLVGAALEHAADLLVKERHKLFPADRKPAHDIAEPLDFVEQFRVFEDNDDQGNALAGLLQLLDTLWPRATYRDGFTADQVASRMLDHGLGLDGTAQELRGLLDAVGNRPMNVVTGHSVGNRLRLVLDNPAATGSEVMILRKRATRGGRHVASLYLVERRKQP
jgi:hypothetical protein